MLPGVNPPSNSNRDRLRRTRDGRYEVGIVA